MKEKEIHKEYQEKLHSISYNNCEIEGEVFLQRRAIDISYNERRFKE